ncbi:MAG: leucyl aminopeptidase [Bryobacteraceae bacterium]
MLVHLQVGPLESLETGALILPVFEAQEDARIRELAGDLLDSGEVTGKSLDMTLVHRPAGLKAKRLLLAGAGKAERFTAAELRKLAGAALRMLKGKSIRDIAIWVEPATEDTVSAAVEGALLADFEPDRYKTDEEGKKTVESFTVAVPDNGCAEAFERGRILAEAQNFARDLVNEPGNRLTPAVLAERARAMAAEHGLEFELLDQDRMRQLGMGALLGVAQGSSEPPVLIILRYRPQHPAGEAAHLGLIGKGVTFDSGGISIKPSESMEKMKYDMAGGAAVLGAMRALAQLKPPIPVTALIPAVENMPGGRAQRPGDIVTTLSGKTVEVINTDAEGRMILADAMAYARQLGCTHLIDAATLTGAIVVSLGHVNVGLFASDDALLRRIQEAARAEGEKMWQMPLEEDYKDYLKSAFADLPNVGGRWGGAITAAMFLKEFADPLPWAHLDIAGTAWLEDAKPFLAKGPTGLPTRTLARVALNWKL